MDKLNQEQKDLIAKAANNQGGEIARRQRTYYANIKYGHHQHNRMAVYHDTLHPMSFEDFYDGRKLPEEVKTNPEAWAFFIKVYKQAFIQETHVIEKMRRDFPTEWNNV